MVKHTPPLTKTMLYAVLLAGSFMFLIPLIWMISTALKPIDQTMAMPPTWLPYRYYAPLNNAKTSVVRGEMITVPSLMVSIIADSSKQIVAKADYVDGAVIEKDAVSGTRSIPAVVIKEIPASMQQPWMKVTPEKLFGTEGSRNAWDVAPASSIIRKVAPRWDNFGKAIAAMKFFGLYLKNTLILCFLTVIGTVVSSALAAYGFARIPWRGRNRTFILVLATMMVPFPVVMVPMFCLYKSLGWIGTLKPLWVGTFCAGAFNVFLLRQFFMTIPKELSEAARIDGCSEWRIFWQIILPLSRPALMVVGLFQFMGTWNDFLGPLIFLTNQKDFTLALGLQFFQSQHGGTEWHYLMAASTMVVMPIIVLFFFTQRTFIEGISMTGIKG
jgi:multiple sugar transport system permease protein